MRKLNLLLALLAFTAFQALAQRTITGKVTAAEDGSSIPGVSVFVKGNQQIGTVTDVDGKFSLTVPKNATSLVFSFIGRSTQEIAITNSNVMNAVMENEAKSLEGVVITAFGIERQARSLGVATAKVSDAQLTQAGVSNVMNGLTAKVSGLQINTINKGVNPDTKIVLRGNRHFLASNQALVVLDGVPISATFLNSINPNDIESVDVLKGASASALYGNEASNGVLVITTRKGANSKPTINVSNTTTFETISYLPNLQTRFGSGSGETVDNADNNYTMWIGPDRNTDPYTSYENQSYGPEYDGSMRILGGKLVDGSYQMVPYSAVKNQKKNFFNTGVSIQNDISYGNGDANNNFFVSAQDVNTTGTIPDDKNRRSTVRVAAGKFYGHFGADFTVGYTHTKTDVAGGDMSQNRGVYWNVLNTPAHIPLTSYKDIVNNPFATLDGYFNAYYPNPYWQLAHSRQITRRNDILGSVNLKYKLNDWASFSNRTGITYNTLNYNDYIDEAIYSDYSHSDPWSQGHMGQNSPYSALSNDASSNQIEITNDLLATLEKKISDFSSKLILGTSMYGTRYNQITDAATALVIPGFYNISNRVGEATVTQAVAERCSIGVFADLTVGYKQYAFLHTSIRNDWDSRLTKENRSFIYPGLDVSFILTDIFPAIKSDNLLSFAKFRAGISKTGQIALSNWYATLPSYVAAAGFPYGGTAGFRLSTTLSNPNLKPEMTLEKEIGLDLSFMKDRIHLINSYYVTNTKDQTIPASISPASGYNSAFINAGELRTNGFECDLKFTPLLNLGDVKWDFSINYAYQTSKVLEVLPGIDELLIPDPDARYAAYNSVSYAVVGQQFPFLKVTDVMRDPQGRIIVDPYTGLPKTNPELVGKGHGNPNHLLGFVNRLSYKGFAFNMVLDYRSGNIAFFEVGQALDFTGVSEHSALNGRQPFVIPNSVIETSAGVYTPNTDVLVTDASRAFWVSSNYHTTQAAYVSSAAFWKLRELALTYSIPVQKFIKNNVVKQAEIGLVGRDLLMLRPKTNVWTDPEFNNAKPTGNSIGLTTEEQTPPTRTFGFSVKLTF